VQEDKRHDALRPLQHQIQVCAQQLGLNYSEDCPAIPTLRKDLKTLRDYGILDDRMYRWGYYIGTGAFSPEELQIAFNALESQALFQGHPLVKQVYLKLKQRLRGFQLPNRQDFFYPVRQHLNRVINYTDPEEMMAKGKHKNSLYHSLDKVEQAILEGQALCLYRIDDPYQHQGLGAMEVYPLQLVYHDIAWYILCEDLKTGGFATNRVNRLSEEYKILKHCPRGSEAQQKSLKAIYKLLENGWGLNLGSWEEQQAELTGTLTLIPVKVRFFPPVSRFILEGERRYPEQRLKMGLKDPETNKPRYVDYSLNLPPRSLDEFSFWVQRYGDKALVMEPAILKERHRQGAIALARRYEA
jgi:predicted DNA-binding transcriptional regulator YafY